MSVFVHQLAFVLAVIALAGASGRIARRFGARGLEIVLAGAAVFGTLAVLEWLALGVVGLGASSLALLLASGVTWVAARLVRPAAQTSLWGAFSEWSRAQPAAVVASLGGVAGAGLAFFVWALRYPALGVDGILYHLPESIGWLHGPAPGSVQQFFYGLPVGNYPLVTEVLQGWGFCLSRSWVPATLLMAFVSALFVLGGWVGLRALEVPALARGLAIASVVLSPLVLGLVNFPGTDTPAAAWLTVCGALVACAVRREPLLMAPALLAGGLAVGSKTTTLPLALLALALGFLATRRVRPDWRTLALPVAGALVVGGLWYVRNLIEHGSPFWPLVATSWGDPVPPVITRFSASLLDRPRYTLSGNLAEYAKLVAGGLVLLAAVVVSPLFARSRAVWAAAGVAFVSVLLWANAPLTGRSTDPVFQSIASGTTRYLLPALCAAALVPALAARRAGVSRWLALALLGAAAIWSLLETANDGFPTVPSLGPPLLGGLLGVGAALAYSRFTMPRVPRALWAPIVLVAALVLSQAAGGFLGRFARTVPEYAPALAAFDARPGYRDRDTKVSMAPVLFAPLAGARMQHDVELMPVDISCAEVEQRVRTGYVVIVTSVSEFSTGVPYNAGRCLAGRQPAFRAGQFTVYAGAGL